MDATTGRIRYAMAAGLALILIQAVNLVGRTARADLIYFRKGGEAQLPATVEGRRIVLGMPDGKIELLDDDIMKRVPGFWPGAELEARRRDSRKQGFAARYATVWWAIENGLTVEVPADLRELHAMDPKHGPTARMVAVLDQLDRPCGEPDLAAFRAALRIEFQVAAGLTWCCSISTPSPRRTSAWLSWSG